MADKIFILSAPSGSGKSTLAERLRSQVKDLEFSVSYTTRAVRGSEQDGREYNFISQAEFDRMLADDAFLEHASVFGNCYGTANSAVAKAHARGRDLLLDIDIQGAAQVMQRAPQAVSIFILPPSPEVLERRLRSRSAAENVTNDAVIERRLRAARLEVERVWEYRYALVNDVLEDAEEQLKAIVEFERGGASGQVARLAQQCNTAEPSLRLQAALAAFGVGLLHTRQRS
jgi:guanylate kinase